VAKSLVRFSVIICFRFLMRLLFALIDQCEALLSSVSALATSTHTLARVVHASKQLARDYCRSKNHWDIKV
jgi:hypothetical protein